jgi:glycerophosphoryl diester phosphodiesterase
MSFTNLFIKPPVIAHRGASKIAPENTLSAFLKAKEVGVNWLEFDVRLAACGEVVIFHDETLDRTTNGLGRVIDYPYAELKKLDAGSWFNPLFMHEAIPTLKATMEFLGRYQMAANVEIKAEPGHEIATAARVMEILDIHLQQKKIPLLISSFSLAVLREVRKYSQDYCLGFLMHEWTPEWQSLCHELNCVSVDINQAILTPERTREIQSTGRLVLSYTVNEIERARELFSWGVDAVYSDYPECILKGVVDGDGRNQ